MRCKWLIFLSADELHGLIQFIKSKQFTDLDKTEITTANNTSILKLFSQNKEFMNAMKI